MEIRNFFKSFVAALAGGMFLCLAGPAQALVMHTAAPSCTGTGTCTATLNSPIPTPGMSSGFSIDVDLDFPFHIELFDRLGSGDPLSEVVQLAMEVSNPSPTGPTVILDMEFRFTDEFGQVIQHLGQDLVLTNTLGFAPMVGFTPTLNFPGDFPLDEIIFHDFIFTANVTTPSAELQFGPLTEVRFFFFDVDSNVGRWPDDIPTPGTLALMGAGLIGLGLLHRRRRRLN